MSIFKKILFIPSVVAVPLSAIAFTSCSTIGTLDTTLATQLETLTSDSAKEVYKNMWSREAFSELYLRTNSLNGIFNSTDKIIITKFLEKFDETKIPDDFKLETSEGIFKTKTEITKEIKNNLFESFKFYTSWKSSTDLQYFINQKSTWVEKNLGLSITKPDGIETWESLSTKFNPVYAYSYAVVGNEVNFMADFEFLYKVIQTGIQTELLNMLITEFYFTTSTSEIIQKGTNYNEIINGNINSLAYLEATSFDLDSPTYFLEKYLVENSPKIKWNYSSDDANKVNNWKNKLIKDVNNYNELWNGYEEGQTTLLESIFSSDLIINSSDALFNKSILNFKGYNPAIELAGSSSDSNIDDVRKFSYNKSGLLNLSSENNQLISFDNLDKIKKIKAINNSASTANNAFLIPISLQKISSITRKKSHQIIMADLVVGPVGSTSPLIDNSYTLGDNTWRVDEIIPILGSSGSQQSIQLNMSYSYNNATNIVNNFNDYQYEVIITWQQNSAPESANIMTELEKNYYFTTTSTKFDKRNVVGINPISEGKINISYYMNLLPNFIWNQEVSGKKEVKIIDGKERAVGKFSMKKTPWDTENADKTNLRKLIFSLYMNDTALITKIKSVLVLNDIALLPGAVKEVNAILKELGILYIENKPDYAKSKNK